MSSRTSPPMLVGTAVIAGLAALFATVQGVIVFGVQSEYLRISGASAWLEMLLRAGINVAAAAVLVGLVVVTRIERRPTLSSRLLILVIAGIAAVVRTGLQILTRVTTLDDATGRATVLAELVTTFVMSVLAVAAGLFADRLWRRARQADRDRLRAQQRTTDLLRELQREELRVRQDLAQTIHGSVQGVFVVLEARLQAVEEALGHSSTDPASIEEVRDVRGALARLRDGELRQMAGRLYPVDLERGLVAAVAALVARLPSTVICDGEYAAALARIDTDTADGTARVLLVRLIEEGLVNALRHAEPRHIRLAVDYAPLTARVEIAIENDGVPETGPAPRSGLARLAVVPSQVV